VVVVGGISSIHGTFVASLAIGVVDTMGRFLLPKLLGFTVGPALASMAIYVLMAVILLARPRTSATARAH
jgi:branched-chain amino acid transport system permease protein